VFNDNGAASLYYDNGVSLSTTATGVDITGTLVSDGLTVDGEVFVNNTAGTTTAGYLYSELDNFVIRSYTSDKDIIFKGNDGGSLIEAMRIDMSAGGSVGIGTSSPSSFNAAGTGIVTVSGTGTGASTLALYSGTTSSGFLYFSDGTTGDDRYQGYIEYSHTNNDMRIGTAASEAMRITSAGNVGIGQSNPTSPNGATDFIHIGNAINQDTSIVLQDAVEIWEIYQNDDLSFLFDTTNVMTLQRLTGNVGIGTLNPDTTLHLQTPSGTKTELNLAQTAVTNYRLSIPASTDALTFVYGASTERMRIDSSGNLLVGGTNTAPGSGNTVTGVAIRGGSDNRSFFSVSANYVAAFNRNTNDGPIVEFNKDGTAVGSIGTQGGDLNIGTAACGIAFVDGVPAIYPWTTTGNTTRDAAIDLGDSGGRFKDLYLSGGALTSTVKFLANTTVSGSDATIFRPADNTMAFSTNGLERMRIDSSGDLILGSTASLSGATITTVSSGNTHNAMRNSAATAGKFWRQEVDNANIFYIINNASTGVYMNDGGTTWVAISDETVKENIVEIEGALDKVMGYRCVEYNLIADENKAKKIGFIAQDWEVDYSPVVVTGADGKLGMQYTETIPVLLKAIQEQQATIEALTARIAALES
jgi:hypothetical protein